MNPQAIIAALPWARRIWKVLPPQLRVPALLAVAAVGVWSFLSGRRADPAAAERSAGAAATGPPSSS